MKKGILFLMLSVLTLGAWADDVTAVVDNISSYSGTASYVYNKADGKIYVRNNLNLYEEYGIYEKVENTAVRQSESVEYISAPDGAYINLGYIPKSNTKIETVFKATEGSDYKALYGTRFEANTQNGVPFPGITNSYSAGNGWKPGFAFFTTNGAVNLGGEKVEKSKMIFGSKIKTIQDAATGRLEIYNGEGLNTLANTIEDSPLQHDCATPLYIFAINKHLPVIAGYNTNPNAFGINSDYCYNPYVTLYSMKIYEGSTLVYDLVPVVADGKGGLKNTLDGTVYTSANGKAFKLSPDKTTVYNGKMVYNTSDNKVYKYNGTEFVLSGNGSRTQTPISGTEYQNMNNWVTNDGHMSIFRDNWTTTANGYKIDPYVGTGGHEPLMIKVGTEIGADYNYSFTASWGAYGSWHSVEMHAYVCNFWDLGTQESGLSVSNSVLATQTFAFAGGTNENFSLDFRADKAEQTLVFQFGDVDDGSKGYWFEFGNLSVKKYVYPEAYPAVDLLKTIALAREEGVDVSAAETAVANLTDLDVALNNLRVARKLKAMRYFDDATIASIEGSEPENGKSYYLLNVGTGMFFACNSDWGTHMALDSKGFLVKLVADGERNGFTDYHISGKESVGWDGFNWTEEYFDKNGESKWHFIPVEGKTKVYNIAIYDNHNWHIIYNPNNLTTDGDKYFNVLKKINGTGYESNPNAQWILLTPEQRTELLAKATDSNPIDATHLIENPNFNKSKASGSDDTKYGWTGLDEIGHFGRYADYVAEFFEKTADAKTTVTGLPAGKYQVSMSGYYREKSFENDIVVFNAGNTYSDEAHLVAFTDESNKVSAPFMHISAEHGKLPGVGRTWQALGGDFLPWDKGDAAQYFETGLYRITTEVITVGSEGQLTIGVEKPNNTGNDANWLVFDNFRLTYLGPTSESVTVSSAGYATYCSNRALDFTGKDIKAYVGTKNGDKLTFTPINQVPANTGLLLVYNGEKTEDVPVIASALAVENNCLVGVNEETTINSNDYILNKVNDGGAGFYKAGSFTTLGAHKAYIPATVGNGVKGFTIDFDDDATGISLMEDGRSQMEDGAIYNVAGQRLSKTQKGINIVNGKKILK